MKKYSVLLLASLSACSATEPWQTDLPKGLNPEEKSEEIIISDTEKAENMPVVSIDTNIPQYTEEARVTEGMITNRLTETVTEKDDKTVTTTEKTIRLVKLTESASSRDPNDYSMISENDEGEIKAADDGSLIETETKMFLPFNQTPALTLKKQTETKEIQPVQQEIVEEKTAEETSYDEGNSLKLAEIGYDLYQTQPKQDLKDIVKMYEIGKGKIRIFGYASCLPKDSEKTQQMNLRLATERAREVANILIESGVKEQDIELFARVKAPEGKYQSRFTEILMDF